MFNFYIKGRVVEFKVSNGSAFVELKQVDESLDKEYLAYCSVKTGKKHFCIDRISIELPHNLFDIVKDGQEYIFEFEFKFDDSNDNNKIDLLAIIKGLSEKITDLLKNNSFIRCISIRSSEYQYI